VLPVMSLLILDNTSFLRTNYLGVRVGQRRTGAMLSIQSVQ
jgi:hypothetical protein